MDRRFTRFIPVLAGLIYLILLSSPAAAARVMTDVKIIHASTGSSHVDAALKNIIPELESVFKYTGYRLINEQQMMLNFNQKGRISLPGNRMMIVIPAAMNKGRINYQIIIRKNDRPVFKTRVLLRNNSST